MIVIAILAIMSGVAIFALGNQGANSAVSACKVDAKSLATALEEYRTDNNGAYPSGPHSTSDVTWKLLTAPQSGMAGSPFLQTAIPTSHYLLWWTTDPNGQLHIWVDHGVLPNSLPAGYLPNPGSGMEVIGIAGACSSYAK